MIVRLPRTVSSSLEVNGDAMLGRLRAYWTLQCGSARVPRADSLYLSDLAVEMPHVLMCFRDDKAFRVEFAGAEVQDLLGFDPTGELLTQRDPVAILAGVARGIKQAVKRQGPELTRGIGWSAIELPFFKTRNHISVFLIGLVATRLGAPAEVLEFRAR
jgi:hypothetical protein